MNINCKRYGMHVVAVMVTMLLSVVYAADVQYAVVAFLAPSQQMAVLVDGHRYMLAQSQEEPHIYTGSAPAPAETYNYVVLNEQQQTVSQETNPRRLPTHDTTTTGYEFFDRSPTVFDVPPLPQAYHPFYPPLFSQMNMSNEVATLILSQANATAIQEILANPGGKFEYAHVERMTYISNKKLYSFSKVGFKNSGKSSKDFARQSFKIDLNEFRQPTESKQLLFGRTSIKLRAEVTDQTMMREKLMLDCLAAAGAATLSGSWVRVFINNEPFGLFVMMDDASTHFIDSVLHGGNFSYPYTGPTYKGNAITPEEEGNLVYVGDNMTLYSEWAYELEDEGRNNDALNKTNALQPLIGFMKELSQIDPLQATSAENQGAISQLLHPHHTMVHLAMSFLSGSWDGVWRQASNYYLNQDTQSLDWTLITYDFDEVFGAGAEPSLATTPYQNFSRPGSQRPLVDAFIQSPYWRSEFEQVLRVLVKRFFKSSAIDPRLDVWEQMLSKDVEWSYSLPSRSPGINVTWTIWNFHHNINATDSSTLGLKEWVAQRSTAVQQQLKFTDVDDLPVLGPYLGGSHWESEVPGTRVDGNIPSSNPPEGNKASKTTRSKVMSVVICLFSLIYIVLI